MLWLDVVIIVIAILICMLWYAYKRTRMDRILSEKEEDLQEKIDEAKDAIEDAEEIKVRKNYTTVKTYNVNDVGFMEEIWKIAENEPFKFLLEKMKIDLVNGMTLTDAPQTQEFSHTFRCYLKGMQLLQDEIYRIHDEYVTQVKRGEE